MEKAKIMLTAITLITIVGGALAFKATNFHSRHLRCYMSGVGIVSTCPTNVYTAQFIARAATTSAPCGKVGDILNSVYRNNDPNCTDPLEPEYTFYVADPQ